MAQLYQWTDADGVLHYTSDLSSIPPAHREAARDIGSPRPLPAPPSPSPAVDPTVLTFSGGGPIVAPIRLNGVGLQLIVDTGADRTVISPAAVARAGLRVDGGRAVRIVGVAGEALGQELIVERLDVAGVRVGPLPVIVHDAAFDPVDGLLGRDVLDFFTLTVDSVAGRAVLAPR